MSLPDEFFETAQAPTKAPPIVFLGGTVRVDPSAFIDAEHVADAAAALGCPPALVEAAVADFKQ